MLRFYGFSPLPTVSPPLPHPSPLHHLPHPLLRTLPSLPPLRAANLHRSSSLADLPSPPNTTTTATTATTTTTTTTNGNQESDAEGPVELPPSSSTIFAVDDNPTPLQTATSVLLTGAISVFLFRSLRRRARRAKELRVRSKGMKTTKDIKEEALQSLKAMGAASVEPGGPPSPVQAMLGGIAAGVIALILYRFATTVEAALSRQAISDNFSVRQITITIRTIINGLCYLATFVFGINSVGLVLYSIQLAFSSFMESPANDSKSSKEGDQQSIVANDAAESSADNSDSRSSDMQQSSDDS